ncbi:MAG: ATP-dependent helicase, partial [Candidatus Hodarchaeales archaeon]
IDVLRRRKLLPLDLFVPIAVSLLRKRNRGIAEFLLVDEFQDTNSGQFAFAREIIKPHDNLIVVGDYFQAIYRWRNAKPENITTGFDKHFPDVKRFPLTVNFRSTPSILAAGSSILPTFYGEEYKHTPVRLESENKEIFVFEPQQSDDEGRILVKWINKLIRYYGLEYKDVMVLYRTHRIGIMAEKALVENSVPYQLISGNMFFGRKEVRDIMAYQSWSLNPADSVSAKRIINRPKRRIGSATVKKINTNYTQRSRPSWPDGAGAKLKEVMNRIYEDIRQERLSCEDWLLMLFHQSGIWQFYKNDEQRLDSFQLMLEWASSADKDGHTPQDFYADLLIVNAGPESETEEDNAVKLMTIHGSKGLESRAVFIAHGVEGVMPTSWASDISEECHLAYVAVTRAKDFLAISMPRSVTSYRSRKPGYPSRFFENILNRDDVIRLNDDMELVVE